MLKTIAIIFGIIMLLIGVLGFIPALTPEGKLLGLFMVNNVHNIIHLATGAVAIICGLTSDRASQIFFAVFGIIYGLVTILGFIQGPGLLLGLVAINQADNWLHFVISALSLYLGFGFCRECARKP